MKACHVNKNSCASGRNILLKLLFGSENFLPSSLTISVGLLLNHHLKNGVKLRIISPSWNVLSRSLSLACVHRRSLPGKTKNRH